MSNIYSILSFDPGLSTLGWAFSFYNSNENKLFVKKYGTYKANKSAIKQKENIDIYGQRFIALNLLEEEVKRLIDYYKPMYISSEDIFLHSKYVNAFTALTLCLHVMRKAAFSRKKIIYTIAPCDIKKITTNTGLADKEVIQKSILSNKNITIQESKQNPINKMCEHEADAIAVGYSFAVSILPTILLEQHDNAKIIIEEAESKKSHTKKSNKENNKT